MREKDKQKNKKKKNIFFFTQKFCFLRGWVVFLSKKKHFFSYKTSVFAGLGGLFGTFFCHFFVIFSCKISVFCEAGRSFLSKKRHFFSCKISVLRGWVLFLVPFLSFFCIFFMFEWYFSFLGGGSQNF